MNEEEIQMFSSFMSLLNGYYVAPEGRDIRVWSPDSRGVFSVKSIYMTSTSGTCFESNETYLWKIPVPM